MNIAPRFPQTRPTFWIARNPETGEVTGYSTRDDAYQGFLDYGQGLDFYQLDPDGLWVDVGFDFGERHLSDAREAREMRRHERSYSGAL